MEADRGEGGILGGRVKEEVKMKCVERRRGSGDREKSGEQSFQKKK